ncbi:distal tail protein Dit [Cytobacillus firmus]|uniref:Uncharacterized protein n=1 Tax=Cytobacillus firmus TaxID=1399 RepID=A0A800MU95_CYTFI|nr:distal tail protein Dit [Cytobacillus firmus]KAF0822507.1 hypothetical protein KIS1582_3724 [Cytobacillus firmus]
MLSFNRIIKPYLQLERGKRRSIFAPLRRNLVTVPGMPGAYLESTDTEIRIIQQPVFIEGKDKYDLRKLEEDLAAWLITDKPAELIFPDEPDRVYYAVVDGSLDIEDIARFGKGTITFICPDPYKYGGRLISSINPAEPAVLVNEGSAPTKPIFRFSILQPTTFIDIISDDDYMSIGQPVGVNDPPFNPRTRRFNDEMKTTVGWGEAFIQPDGGAKVGAMTILGSGEEFGATDYGSGSAWHGPMLQKTFDPCSDYFIRVRFNVRTNKSNQRARGEMYLLTTNGNQIGKISAVIRDTSMRATIEVRLQNGLKVHYPVNRINAFEKGFYGFVSILKEGSKFTFDIGVERDTGYGFEVTHKETHYFDDINGDYQLPLSGVVAHVSNWNTAPLPYRARLRSVVVEQVNQGEGIPYIVQPGDEVIIDFKREVILINDEPRTDLKDFGANYFSLPPGENVIVLNPPDAFDAEVEWRDCYK